MLPRVAKGHVFQHDLIEDILISQALDGVQNPNASQMPFGIVIRSQPFAELLGRNRLLTETYMKGIYFGA